MEIFRGPADLPPAWRGSVLAIGNFDGVHRGHRLVLSTARAVAEGGDWPLGAMAFEPHPRSLTRPDDPPFRLTLFDERARLLRAAGVQMHVVVTFDRHLLEMSPDDFIDQVLVAGLGVRHVVVGHDFCFGHNRVGTVDTLTHAGASRGFGVTVVTKASDESGGIYSSTAARQNLRAGRMREAADILGRPWEISGPVDEGDHRGRLLGFPTANIALGEHLRPALGVYAVRVGIVGNGPDRLSAFDEPEVWHDGVANLGIRPMYALPEPILEAHLFDFSGDLYGRLLRVQLIEFLRSEAAFNSVDALVHQMHRDSEAAKAALAE
ncbi:MAG: bifunctional riboflavin kinase/FAD synthetase [Rhodospirillaceae bacterium]|nr:bifunctional riboflavin kinase/FAD synthetase [Rhodospirillaceae bacterium]